MIHLRKKTRHDSSANVYRVFGPFLRTEVLHAFFHPSIHPFIIHHSIHHLSIIHPSIHPLQGLWGLGPSCFRTRGSSSHERLKSKAKYMFSECGRKPDRTCVDTERTNKLHTETPLDSNPQPSYSTGRLQC